jgi:hypothetical protein
MRSESLAGRKAKELASMAMCAGIQTPRFPHAIIPLLFIATLVMPLGGCSSASSASLRLMRLDTGAITTVATSTIATPTFAFSWPWAGWVIPSDNQGNGSVRFKDLATGQIAPFKTPVEFGSQAPNELQLDGVTAIFGYGGRQLFIVPDVTQPSVSQEIYDSQSDGGVEFATMSDRLISWQSSDSLAQPYLFDRSQHALVTMPTDTTPVSLAWTGGPLLVWQDPVSAAQAVADQRNQLISLYTLCVVDTGALPATPPV